MQTNGVNINCIAPPHPTPNKAIATAQPPRNNDERATFHSQYEGERKLCLVVVVQLREGVHLLRRQAVQTSACLLPLHQGGA